MKYLRELLKIRPLKVRAKCSFVKKADEEALAEIKNLLKERKVFYVNGKMGGGIITIKPVKRINEKFYGFVEAVFTTKIVRIHDLVEFTVNDLFDAEPRPQNLMPSASPEEN